MPLYVFEATGEWEALSNADRSHWLNNKLAKLREMQTKKNGIVWFGGAARRAGDSIFLLWNLEDVPALRGFIDEVMDAEDTQQFFKVTFIQGGEPFTDESAVYQRFDLRRRWSKRSGVGLPFCCSAVMRQTGIATSSAPSTSRSAGTSG